MNASSLIDSLKKVRGLLTQSEFETRGAYEARLADLQTKPLAAGHSLAEQFTFVVGGAWDGQASVSRDDSDPLAFAKGAPQTAYDAETGTMTVVVRDVPGIEYGPEFTSLGWSYSGHTTGHHVGINAFGVKKVISEGVSVDTTLQMQNSDLTWLSKYCKQDFSRDLQCQFALSSDQARASSKNIQVAVGGILRPPFFKEESGKSAPTIEAPYETVQIRRGVYLDPNQVVIFDRVTGKVLAQFDKVGFARDYSIQVEIKVNSEPKWDDPLCANPFVRNSSVSLSYKVDDEKEIHVFRPEKPISVHAENSVAISAPYCVLPRIAVLKNGQPYTLRCQKQTQFALNTSNCEPMTR